MALTDQERLLAYTVEKVNMLEAVLMGVVMFDRSPHAFRKTVEKHVAAIDASELYKLMSDEELEIVQMARADTFEKVFRGVPPEKPDTLEQLS